MRKHFFVIMLACLGLLLASCGPVAAPPVTPDPPEATLPPVAPTATIEPSPTPQPGRVVLIAPPGADAQALQPPLTELAATAGWELESRTDLPAGELKPEMQVVVMLAPAANLAELLAAAPQAQFIVFSTTDLPAASNLTVIQRRAEIQAFLAGYISVLLSPDYRAAGLLPSDGPLGERLQEAYVNGGRYFCGVCAPGWPLGMYFPMVAGLPAASDGPAWVSAAADMFDNKKVDLYFITPEALTPDLIDYLQGRMQLDRTVRLVGMQSPPDALREQWAASLVFDDVSALREVWPQVSAGQGGGSVTAPLALDYVNEGLLSQGRLRLIEDLMEELAAGWIDPFTIASQ